MLFPSSSVPAYDDQSCQQHIENPQPTVKHAQLDLQVLNAIMPPVRETIIKRPAAMAVRTSTPSLPATPASIMQIPSSNQRMKRFSCDSPPCEQHALPPAKRRRCVRNTPPSASVLSLQRLPRELLHIITSHVATDPASSSSSCVLTKLLRLFPVAAASPVLCDSVMTFTRSNIRFDNILIQLATTSAIRQRLETHLPSEVSRLAARNAVNIIGRPLSDNVHSALFGDQDPVCRFACMSLLFMDAIQDPFFSELDADKLYNVVSPSSIPCIVETLNYIKPRLQSFNLTPLSDLSFPVIVDPLVEMLSSTSESLRGFTVCLPCDHLTEDVSSSSRLSLSALEEFRIKFCGEHEWQYNSAHTEQAIHLLFARLSFTSPRLNRIVLENVAGGRLPQMKIDWLPLSVYHVVIRNDFSLMKLLHSCCGLQSVTFDGIFFDVAKFNMLMGDDTLPHLNTINFVGCSFQLTDSALQIKSRRKMSCVRKIMNDPSGRPTSFQVEGLPLLISDLPSLEVLELRLDTKADSYICEILGYITTWLPMLKVFTLQVSDSRLCDESASHFQQFFRSLISSDSRLEHLSIRNMWVCTDLLLEYLEKKGRSLKTLDVNMHSPCCTDEGSDQILTASDTFEVLNMVGKRCPDARNVCLGDVDRVTNMGSKEKRQLLGRYPLASEQLNVERVLNEVVRRFDRDRTATDIYEDGVGYGNDNFPWEEVSTVSVGCRTNGRKPCRRESR
ncbi:hypothetical protein BWQ96_02910 [Gracilariopsis chorda]|uniref:Uncharacterized protein n=1 Tax=Gracilariopsis chorda TaxID=448386 RepID=A0A2V3J041_9FLOR|nr:hypothetical protein BWQ96_02910 [Gracilariopsis chorda]|eukprot:PXF47297.1 hypothetical protein BWQ96_02910 [Gracilariopsis chorda]